MDYISSVIKSGIKGILVRMDEPGEKVAWNLVILSIFTLINYLIFNYYEAPQFPDDPSRKLSVTDAFYYTGISQFTIGFGDIAPKTNLGRIVIVLQVIFVWFVNMIPPQFIEKSKSLISKKYTFRDIKPKSRKITPLN